MRSARRSHKHCTCPRPRHVQALQGACLGVAHPTSRGHVPPGEPAPEARGRPLLLTHAMRQPGRPSPRPPLRRPCQGTGSLSRGRHQAGRRRGWRTRPSPTHPKRPASAHMDTRCAGVVRRCGARRLAIRHEWRHPIGCPQRTGKGGGEAAGEGIAATSPEAGENVARGCPGGARTCRGGRGPKVWPGTPARVGWEGPGMKGKEEENHARDTPTRGSRRGRPKAGGYGLCARPRRRRPFSLSSQEASPC